MSQETDLKVKLSKVDGSNTYNVATVKRGDSEVQVFTFKEHGRNFRDQALQLVENDKAEREGRKPKTIDRKDMMQAYDEGRDGDLDEDEETED